MYTQILTGVSGCPMLIYPMCDYQNTSASEANALHEIAGLGPGFNCEDSLFPGAMHLNGQVWNQVRYNILTECR